MRHGSLFSGIGGFDLVAKWMGWENVFQCEIDPFCNAVLKKHFPNTIRYEKDIREVDFTEWNGSIDVISGGPPCQSVSKAGKRKGKQDARWLWPEYIRAVREIAPIFIVGENVPHLARLGLDEILDALDDSGYLCQPFRIPASAVGGFINRDRIWIIGLKKDAYDPVANRIGPHRKEKHEHGRPVEGRIEFPDEQICLPGSLVSESVRNGTDSRIFGTTDGVSYRVERIKSIGNAICPSVALQIFKIIQKIKNQI